MTYRNEDFPTYVVDKREAKRRGDILWIFSGPWSVLDNFALTPVRYNGWQCPTSEHAFAAMKAANPADARRIVRMPGPHEAKALGRQVRLRSDWEEIKFSVMWEVLCFKFAQNPYAVDVLIATDGRQIVEGNTWNDRVWGMTDSESGHDLIGQNALGKMLMALRDSELKKRRKVM